MNNARSLPQQNEKTRQLARINHIGGQFRRIGLADQRDFLCFVDGHPVNAQIGDTVLSLIMLSRRHLRRFEFDDSYRAGFCLIGSCQDCWVQLADGKPVRACTTLVSEGMRIELSNDGGHD